MTEHTPLPWAFSPWHIEEGPSAVRAPDGHLVTTTASDADAAYIVKACNAFPDLVKALERLSLAYVNLLELGRDRIIALGGTCDPVDVMEAGDPSLRAARDVLARVKRSAGPWLS